MTFRFSIKAGLLAAALALPCVLGSAVADTPHSAETSRNLPDGLRIIDTQVGNGVQAGPNTTVVVNYTGYLDADGERGKKFDASSDHGHPLTFTIGAHDVIAGWDEGVSGMRVGGKRTLIVPPELAYGEKDQGSIPPWSTLIFDIELTEVK